MASSTLPILMNHPLAITSLVIFGLAYILIIVEEFIGLKKSKPILLVSALIWLFVAIILKQYHLPEALTNTLNHNLLEFCNLFLFLLVAMTYVHCMEERLIFAKLRGVLLSRKLNYRQLFWVTGILSFFISPIADNLTTALIMCAVVLAVGKDNPKFISIACVNIVVAANAGGAYSPFGDITTLMVWQSGFLNFLDFFHIFIPSAINFLVPAIIMHFAVPQACPTSPTVTITLKRGATRILFLFLLTITATVLSHYLFHLPPAIAMMMGLSCLMLFSTYLARTNEVFSKKYSPIGPNIDDTLNVFKQIERAEWDTLLFFYGIILAVGGLAVLGYLAWSSELLYQQLGAGLPSIHHATPANAIIGIVSAIFGNIPVMYAVLTMRPEMSAGQWLLVTLTAGVGGSLFATGSAAGVALLGEAKGAYTFFSHLKWSWAILLGYMASIAAQLILNAGYF